MKTGLVTILAALLAIAVSVQGQILLGGKLVWCHDEPSWTSSSDAIAGALAVAPMLRDMVTMDTLTTQNSLNLDQFTPLQQFGPLQIAWSDGYHTDTDLLEFLDCFNAIDTTCMRQPIPKSGMCLQSLASLSKSVAVSPADAQNILFGHSFGLPNGFPNIPGFPTSLVSSLLDHIPTGLIDSALGAIPTQAFSYIPTQVLSELPTGLLTAIPAALVSDIPTNIPTAFPTNFIPK